MAKITVVARNTHPYVDEELYDGELYLRPKEAPRRAQVICNRGIFNLMGITRPGTYTIKCTRVEKKRRG